MSVSVHDQNTLGDPDFICEEEKLILKSCHICSRTFNPNSLERHEKICEKTRKSNHRNVFNSFLQRSKEINAVPVTSTEKEDEKKKSKRKRKEEHEKCSYIRQDRSQRAKILNNGLSPQKIAPPGYQQCPSCKRHFNQKAADRHIIWCQEQQTRLPKTPPNSEALDRLKARVKYRAPLPRKKQSNDSNRRLVKSADSLRESNSLRTHSSPSLPVRETTATRHCLMNSNPSVLDHCKNAGKSSVLSNSTSKSSYRVPVLKEIEQELKTKKSVKFKERFPVYSKESNKNLDMLAALRLRLSQLSTSDDVLEDFVLRSNENENLTKNVNMCNFPSSVEMRDQWSSDGEMRCSTSSSSDASLPSVAHVESLERRMPRFCYNCGTKYPIVSAKYCCECGARRFIIGSCDQQLSMMS